MLTPLDIQKRTFSRAISGFSQKEVEEFLTLVSGAMEKHINENFDLKERCEQLEREISKYHALEKTMSDTLVVAKSTSEEMLSSAHKTVELMLSQAEHDGERIRRSAEQDVEKQIAKLEDLKADFSGFKTRFVSVLKAQQEIVENYKVDVDVK